MNYRRPPPNVEGMTSLKVENLTYRITPNTLRRIFERYGRVGDVYIPRDRFTKESRGFAFVRFHDRRHAEKAIDALDGVLLHGRELRLQMARYGRPPDPHRGGRGTPTHGYTGDDDKSQSRSLRLCRPSRSSSRRRSTSPSQSRSRFSHSKSLPRSYSRAPSTSRCGSPRKSKSRFTSVSRSRSRSLLLEYKREFKSSSPCNIPSDFPEEEGEVYG